MILETYLKKNNTTIREMHIVSGIPKTTIRDINKRDVSKWNVSYIDAVAKTVGKDRMLVMEEINRLHKSISNNCLGKYNIENRRYIGNKTKLLSWISELIEQHTEGKVFFDVFAGTGVVTKEMMNNFDEFIINDFLYSNNIIYKAFFGDEYYDEKKIVKYQNKFQNIEENKTDDGYFQRNLGGKFFSDNDTMIIGEIRTVIKDDLDLNEREKAILVASLIYSCDKIANTVGHYDAYRKKVELRDRFVFELINPIKSSDKKIEIYREDANILVSKVTADVAFIDPPYNSRQYSRFYHVLENIAKWDKPELYGVAMKPVPENMSDFSRVNAPDVFDDLISKLKVRYIVVTYNNTYASKSNSSKNKISHEQIIESLNKVGETQVFQKPFKFFNAGNTELKDHKEFVFITKINKA